MANLREQVAAIKSGDTVTARFKAGRWGEFTVSGVVSEDVEHWTGVAGHQLANRHGVVLDTLVAIESHEPAKPPTPEPTGDVVVRLEDDERSDVWLVPVPNGWLEFGDMGEPATFADWADVLAWREKYATGPLTVFAPKPSPERIEGLVDWLNQSWAEGREDLAELGREFARRLLAGASDA